MEGFASRVTLAIQSVCALKLYLPNFVCPRKLHDLPTGTAERLARLFTPLSGTRTTYSTFSGNASTQTEEDTQDSHPNYFDTPELDRPNSPAVGGTEEKSNNDEAEPKPFDNFSKPDAGVDDTAEQDIEWTPEMVQAVREQEYLTLDLEDESDYTRGPARMTNATDGVVTCAALLMTLELSQAIQDAIKAQRDYNKAQRAADERLEAISNLRSALSSQVDRTQIRLDSMSEWSEVDESQVAALEEELSILEMMAEEYKLERTSIQNNMEFRGDTFRAAQAKVNALLEDAWIDAQLLKPEYVEMLHPAPEADLQTEYLAFRQKLKANGDLISNDETDGQLDTSNDHLLASKTAEAQAQEAETGRLQKDLWDAWDLLQTAQAAFDNRDDDRHDAEKARYTQLQRGQEPEDASSEAFDVSWHLHERKLTRELIDAETAYVEANAAAIAAGAVEACDDQLIGYGDADDDGAYVEVEVEVDDGYRLSFEQDVAASAPMARIRAWLAGIPDVDAASDAVTAELSDRSVDEWDAEELDFGDCRSHILANEMAAGQNPLRKKIDEWHRVQRELGLQFASASQVMDDTQDRADAGTMF